LSAVNKTPEVVELGTVLDALVATMTGISNEFRIGVVCKSAWLLQTEIIPCDRRKLALGK